MILAICIGILVVTNTMGQCRDIKDKYRIRAVPYLLNPYNTPEKISIVKDSMLVLCSRGKTNLYNSPSNKNYKQDAAMLLFHPDSSFILRAKVKANLLEKFDVASLVLFQNNNLWAKLCFENSINKEATVVSVVTNTYSDDCNSSALTDTFVYLSIVKKGDEISFHYSKDNRNWSLVRYFRQAFDNDSLMIGFAVHAIRENNFSAEFSEIYYSGKALVNMRKYEE